MILAVSDTQVQRLFFVLKNADWTLELRPVVNAADSRERVDTINSVLAGRADDPRSIFTGDCDGLRRAARLARRAATSSTSSARASRSAQAAAAARRRPPRLRRACDALDDVPRRAVAAIREQTRAPIILVASGGEAAAMLEQALEPTSPTSCSCRR